MASLTEVIAVKRDRGRVSADDLYRFASGVASGEVTLYQASAFLMAAYINGMCREETTALTMAIRDSGKVLRWKPDLSPLSDKHSTGGVGDKISLILAPLAASMGIRVPMLSGRSLGHTGGTLDKLQSIPGFDVNLGIQRFQRQVEDLGLCMIGQTPDLAPADGVFYSLRDATATVTSIPLITASILGKKLAENPDSLVFDVKCGSGAFMKNRPDARALAESLVETSRSAGLRATALITPMNQPTGLAVGNALEVREALEVLSGRGPADTRKIALVLASAMGELSRVSDPEKTAEEKLDGGSALALFQRMVEAQGGDLERFDGLPDAPEQREVRVDRSGFWNGPEARATGNAVRRLGGGRYRVEDEIDPRVGWLQLVPCGTHVKAGDPVGVVHASDSAGARAAAEAISESFRWDSPPDPVVLERLS